MLNSDGFYFRLSLGLNIINCKSTWLQGLTSDSASPEQNPVYVIQDEDTRWQKVWWMHINSEIQLKCRFLLWTRSQKYAHPPYSVPKGRPRIILLRLGHSYEVFGAVQIQDMRMRKKPVMSCLEWKCCSLEAVFLSHGQWNLATTSLTQWPNCSLSFLSYQTTEVKLIILIFTSWEILLFPNPTFYEEWIT